jgi:hypothetical protein
MSAKGIALCLAVLLVCFGMAACGPTPTPVPPTDTLTPGPSERLVVQVDFSSWIQESFTVSPDSQRVAYGAVVSDKWFVVVDGKEEQQYDGIGAPIFSPDSQRVAYGAGVGNKQFVVVDGKEGKPYDGIVGGRIVFDSADSLHYLAFKGTDFYLVEERIK